MLEEKKQSGGAEYSTENARKVKARLIKMMGPVLAECYRNMTKDEFDDACNSIILFGHTAREMIPTIGPEAMKSLIEKLCQED